MSYGLLRLQSLCSHHPAFLPSSNVVLTLWSERRKGTTLGFAEQVRVLPPVPKDLEVRAPDCTPMRALWTRPEQSSPSCPEDPAWLPGNQARSSCYNVSLAKEEWVCQKRSQPTTEAKNEGAGEQDLGVAHPSTINLGVTPMGLSDGQTIPLEK